VVQLSDALVADATARECYTTYYGVSAAPEFTDRTFPVYRCALANITPTEFLMCLSGVSKPRTPRPHPDRKVRAGR
jgi:hypothetical protein